MNEDVDWNLLAKYLFEECSEEEAAEVQAWMKSDPKRAALLRQFHQMLQARNESSSSNRWNTEALWARIQEKTQSGEADSQSSAPAPEALSDDTVRKTRKRRRPSRLRGRRSAGWTRTVWAGIVATMIFATGVFWLRDYSEGEAKGGARAVETFTTEKGERATIRLSEGTHVRLNVNSRLTIPKTFGDEKRVVELEGEAFFEVATDSTNPFIVRAGGTVTRVLGTAFDVSAYPEDEGTKVVVSEGRVAFRVDNERAKQKEEEGAGEEDLVLTKRQMARLLRTGERMVRRESDISRHLAWMEGEIAFEDASFREVMRSLERWYALDIALREGDAPPSGHLNAKFSSGNQDLEEVLDVVATAFRLEYNRQGKQVIFSRIQ